MAEKVGFIKVRNSCDYEDVRTIDIFRIKKEAEYTLRVYRAKYPPMNDPDIPDLTVFNGLEKLELNKEYTFKKGTIVGLTISAALDEERLDDIRFISGKDTEYNRVLSKDNTTVTCDINMTEDVVIVASTTEKSNGDVRPIYSYGYMVAVSNHKDTDFMPFTAEITSEINGRSNGELYSKNVVTGILPDSLVTVKITPEEGWLIKKVTMAVPDDAISNRQIHDSSDNLHNESFLIINDRVDIHVECEPDRGFDYE